MRDFSVWLRFSVIILFATVMAQARPVFAKAGYFNMYCAKSGCHAGTSVSGSPEDTPTCAGCHYHGMYTGRRTRVMNFRGSTDRSVYGAGEPMTISVTGGDQPGWVRVRLLDQNSNEIARATGPTGMGDDGTLHWTESTLPGPILLRARAPYLPGTYQWKVSWFGYTYYPNPAALTEHIYLRYHDVQLPAFDVYSNDAAGPTLSAVTLSPSPSGGVRHIALTALASDAGTGMTPIAEARYRIVPSLESGAITEWRAMEATDGSFDDAGEQVKAAVELAGLGTGPWSLEAKAADAMGNWGPVTTAPFEISAVPPGDVTPPASSCQGVDPGIVPPGTPVILMAMIDDRSAGGSPIFDAEAFLSSPGSDGTGISLLPQDGALDSPVESIAGSISTDGLADGAYPVLIHGRDAAGNWGPYCLTSFVVQLSADTQGPAAGGLTLSPNPTVGSDLVTLYADASDMGRGGTAITAAEFYVGAAPIAGAGRPMQAEDGGFDSPVERLTGALSTAGWAPGAYTVGVRARDEAGRWGPDSFVSLQVTHDVPDRQGPDILALAVSPDPTAGASLVTLSGKVDETATGGSKPVLFEYFLEMPGRVGSGRQVSLKTSRASARFSVPVEISMLDHMTYAVYARAMDQHGNWGALTAVAFNVTP